MKRLSLAGNDRDMEAGRRQATMEIQKSIGQIQESIKGLSEDSKAQGEKLEKLERILYAASIVGLIVVVVGGFLINKLWDPALAAPQKIAKLP